MFQFLAHPSETCLGDDPAQKSGVSRRDATTWMSAALPRFTKGAHGIFLLGLLLALIPGLALLSGNLGSLEDLTNADGRDGASMTVRVQPGFPVPVTRLRSRSAHKSHKHHFELPKVVVSNDPNDDGTSGDPDEDDDNETSKFVNGPDDTDAPIMEWCQELAPFRILHECAPATATPYPSSAFLTLQRLRC